ncbi:hypothetical protein [Microbulbifer sp. TRSA005]|uniref:hypothetical protein n=1 Tax=unclassified Microbulbifer TaxID=2619833 RepID=UPI00403A3EC1
MVNQAPVAFTPQADNFLDRSIDIANFSLESINKLRTLFQSISLISESNATSQELAVIGAYLADEWANLIECGREDLERRESKQ